MDTLVRGYGSVRSAPLQGELWAETYLGVTAGLLADGVGAQSHTVSKAEAVLAARCLCLTSKYLIPERRVDF